ncbi:condensation domain-containing protein [Dyadobacter sp. LHD-138]|uniref:condensation domain-containing protein n=1 Tax=Dyadobacter sp. LHD-138 TaxID=3071413 RepID=UPI0027DEC0DB|nr:condensation domain-containing protein [Dyadobacter sp. LHD-138]MDQ6481216.1 condensation domain-containing protein [Dyadobacter sp. LHD-138]
MKRKLTFIEGTMYAGGHLPVNVVAGIKIKGNIREERLQLALIKVQKRHPMLRVNVLEDDKNIPYFSTKDSACEIPVRIVTRHSNGDWKKEYNIECLTPFDCKNGPLIRVVWLKSDTESDLIFTCHHCICDGKTILNLIDETLHLLEQPDAAMGTYDTFASILDFIPETVKNNRINRLTAALISRLARLALLVVSLKKEVKRENPYLIHWKLDKETSDLILKKCKTEGSTIHTALCVAFLKAYQSVETIRPHARLYCAVDMRKFIPEIKNDMMFAFPAMIGLTLKKDKTINFWTQARQFKEALTLKMDKMEINKVLMYSESLLSSLPQMTKYARADTGTHDFTLSNMGKASFKENYTTFEIETLYPPATIFPFGNPSTLFSTAFRGEIDFIFSSDEKFVKYQDAVVLKNNAMKMLLNQA